MEKFFMQKALCEAQKAHKKNEVPVGAVIVKNGKIIAKAHNTRNKSQIATNHAEILAINKACKKLKSWILEGCDIYVTLEPCPMCLGAILNARISKLFFGAYDKTGNSNILDIMVSDNRLNHKISYTSGILEKECSNLITSFFKEKRNKKG